MIPTTWIGVSLLLGGLGVLIVMYGIAKTKKKWAKLNNGVSRFLYFAGYMPFIHLKRWVHWNFFHKHIADAKKRPFVYADIKNKTYFTTTEEQTPKPEGSLRFVCVSDTHEKHWQLLSLVPETADVLLHAGDLLMTNRLYSESASHQKLNDLGAFFTKIGESYPLSVVIGGNHDFIMPTLDQDDVSRSLYPARFSVDQYLVIPFDDPKSASFVDLDGLDSLDASLVSRSVLLFASPFSIGKSKNRAFQHPRGAPEINALLSPIPHVDVFMTHGNPHRHLQKKGCDELKEFTSRTKPLVHVFGHHHGGYGVDVENVPGVVSINAASSTNKYVIARPPIVFDLFPEDCTALSQLLSR